MPEDKLTTTTKPPIGGLRKGILANKTNYEQQLKSIDPKAVPNRLGLVMDDSGSMGRQGMEDAHTAIRSFTSSCNPQDTSIAVYPLNAGKKPLTCDFDLVNAYVGGIWATGGTPIYTTLNNLVNADYDNVPENITRAIVFSDGSPTDSSLTREIGDYYLSSDTALAKKVIAIYQEKKIPVDTIYIGTKDTSAHKEMQKLAELTGGTCVHFQDTLSLSKSLKYLAPKFRALLSNPEIKARIERGE